MTLTEKVYRELKYLKRDFLYQAGIGRDFFKKAAGSQILVYHGICLKDHTRFNPVFLTRKMLESHFRFYKKYFNIVTLDDYYNERFDKTRFNICITFDDGFANNYKYVLPLLNDYKIPAAFFITAIREAGHDILWNDFLGIATKYGPPQVEFENNIYYKNKYGNYAEAGEGHLLKDRLRSEGFDKKVNMMKILSPLVSFRNNTDDEDFWLQMDQSQIEELSRSEYVTIGSHGYYHNDLARTGEAGLRDELINSKRYLERITKGPVSAIAFPYGSYSDSVLREAMAAGYTQLLGADLLGTGDNLPNKIFKGRLTINPFVSTINQMYATITGKYEKHF